MKPIFKWAGGKTRLLPVLRDIIGNSPIRDYYEPCGFGGGALFFDIWRSINGNSYLNDINPALIDAYKAIRTNPKLVAERLSLLKEAHYEQVKERFNYQDPATPIELKAARFIYLNHCCFNGLWRVNKAGEFNVPVGRNGMGKENSLATFDFSQIAHISMALQSAKLECLDLRVWAMLKQASAMVGDLVFFDPPYLDTFNGYSAGGFGLECHENLIQTAKVFAEQGARVIVCASDTDATREVYGDPTICITLNRTIGASKRGAAKECLYLY
jgi:DNA adenine methylase